MQQILIVYPNTVYFAYGALSALDISADDFIKHMQTVTGLSFDLTFIDHVERQRERSEAVKAIVEQGIKSVTPISN